MLTLTALSELTGSTWRTIRARLAAAGVQPSKRGGKSDLYASDQALRAIYARPGAEGELDLSTERAHLANVQRQRAELHLTRERGEVAHVETIAQVMAEAALIFRAHALGKGNKLGPICAMRPAREVAAVVDREMREMLESILDATHTWAGEVEHGEAKSEATEETKQDGERDQPIPGPAAAAAPLAGAEQGEASTSGPGSVAETEGAGKEAAEAGVLVKP
jgi:phage terminase Nu1 subunit (DNA packaging protein)